MAQLLGDEIAKSSIRLYESLPKHGKPRVRDNGVPEWTILASISLVRNDGSITPISLGAGVKVLPATKLPPLGDTIHDCHAEILARRGFIRWIMEEARLVVSGKPHMDVLELMTTGKLRWKEEVQVWLYVSALPCGDASTLHTAAHQPADMAALKSSAEGYAPMVTAGQAIRGRNGYESFGAIRTKPGRADSNPTICMSCSDKIASWNVLGVQGALLANIMESPIYLDGIVVGGVEEVPPDAASLPKGSSWWDTIRKEAERSLDTRLTSVEGTLDSPYKLNRPAILLSTVAFPLSKPEVALRCPSAPEPVPNVQCILHIPQLDITEVLHHGCKSGGGWKAPGTTLLPPKARSAVCKYEIFKSYLSIKADLQSLSHPGSTIKEDDQRTLFSHKHEPNSAYQKAKAALRGVPGAPELLPSFENCGTFSVTAASKAVGAELKKPPFAGWIVSGERWESFTLDGAVQSSSL